MAAAARDGDRHLILPVALIDELVLEVRGQRRTWRRRDEEALTSNERRHHHPADRPLFLLLGSGVWIGLTLSGVAWIGMQLFSTRPAGDAMAVTIWGSASSWTLTALPLFIWMGEILFRTRLSRGHVQGPRAVDAARCPGGCCTPT